MYYIGAKREKSPTDNTIWYMGKQGRYVLETDLAQVYTFNQTLDVLEEEEFNGWKFFRIPVFDMTSQVETLCTI